MTETGKINVISIIMLVLVVLMFIMIGTHNSSNIEVIEYCKIDSISTSPKYEFSPELLTKYHTNCDITFYSNKEYNIGDSIQIKTIIIQ